MVSSVHFASHPALEQASPKEPTSHAHPELLDILKQGAPSSHRKKIAECVTELSPEDLETVLQTYFEEIVATMEGDRLLPQVEELAKILDSDALAHAPATSLRKARNRLHEANYFLEHRELKAPSGLKRSLTKILRALIAFIDSIISAFGVADFFTPAATQIQRDFKFQKIMMLVSCFSMFTTLLLPVLGAEIAGPIIGGTLLLIAVMSLIWPHVRPSPEILPGGAKNWTHEASEGLLGASADPTGRKAILDEMANTLIQNKTGQVKKHPLLTGPSRVGKTQAGKAFAAAIERGDYPELAGMKVFYLNTDDLRKDPDFLEAKRPIEQLSTAMGRHRGRIILILDEIQAAFQDDDTSLGQKLKSMLDAGGDFPYVIAITTSGEFEKHLKDDPAFVNRFHSIEVKSTDFETTQEILTRSLLQNHPSVLLAPGALEKIYEMTKEKPQPYTAQLLLNKCLELTSSKCLSPNAVKKQELLDQKERLASKGIFQSYEIDHASIDRLDTEIAALEELLLSEQKEMSKLLKTKEMLPSLKLQNYLTLSKVAHIQAEVLSGNEKAELNKWLMLERYLIPSLEKFVKAKAQQLGVKVVIDEEIIKSACQQI